MREVYFRLFAGLVHGRTVGVSRHGCNFELDLGEMIDLAVFLGVYEPSVTSALLSLCGPTDTVVDAGANIGAHTLPLARRTVSGGRVIAFEPTKYAFGKLGRNLSLNNYSHTVAVNAALSDKKSTDPAADFRSSWPTRGPRADRPGSVDFISLDEWCAANGINRVDLMKIDVDGFEYLVLKGGLALIEKSRPHLVMEAVGPHFRCGETNPFALLAELGYKFYNADSRQEYADASAVGVGLSVDDDGMTTSRNIVATVSGWDT